jgi:hypothetical protein
MTLSKFQITNFKSQISSKSQFQMTETNFFEISNLSHWNLFVIWCLGFGAYLD